MAIPSENVFAVLATYDSMQCVSASMPQATVPPRGMVTENDGSRMATSGIRRPVYSRTEYFLFCTGSLMSAARVHSEPVPALVAMQHTRAFWRRVKGAGGITSSRVLYWGFS